MYVYFAGLLGIHQRGSRHPCRCCVTDDNQRMPVLAGRRHVACAFFACCRGDPAASSDEYVSYTSPARMDGPNEDQEGGSGVPEFWKLGTGGALQFLTSAAEITPLQ